MGGGPPREEKTVTFKVISVSGLDREEEKHTLLAA